MTQTIIESINLYATPRTQEMSAKKELGKRSRFSKWEDVTVSELFKFLATTISMGIDPRPDIHDYFASQSSNEFLYTPLYHEPSTTKCLTGKDSSVYSRACCMLVHQTPKEKTRLNPSSIFSWRSSIMPSCPIKNYPLMR